MELEESIFRAWLRGRKRFAKQPAESSAIQLRNVRNWLTTLGVLLRGELPEIRGGDLNEDPPSWFFFFPDETSLLPTPEENRALLLFRLLYFIECEKQEIYLPNNAMDAVDVLLFTVLAERLIVPAIEARYPGAKALRSRLYAAVLGTRRPLHKIENGADCLELAAQERLGLERRQLAFSRTELANFSEAIRKKFCRAELEERFSELAAARRKLKWPRSEESAAVILWGALERQKETSASSAALPGEAHRTSQGETIEFQKTVRLKKNTGQKPNNPLFHAFEKTESVEDYQGESSPAEAAEDLKADEEGLHDLSLGHVIRTFDDTPGLLRAEIADDPGVLNVAESAEPEAGKIFYYSEWDQKERAYREQWCRVIETRQQSAGPGPAGDKIAAMLRRAEPHIREIRQELLRLLSTRIVRNRQLDGPEIDLESLVERHADLCAGTTPPERLYLSPRRTMKEIAVLLLFDTSLSTDSWVQGRRVLDVESETLLILARAFRGLFDDEVAAAHFNSRTRNECRFSLLKNFAEPWDDVIGRCAALEPFGYTRIGPAIRHATSLLHRVRARKKFLVIVSDGKPTDYDQYEGRYGVRDVAQAVREAKQLSIATFALAVEHQPKHYLAEMFGSGRFHILPKSELLPAYVASIFIEAIR